MPLIAEDGTARPDANTFVLAAAVAAYAASRGLSESWLDADPDVQEAAIVKAADYLKNEKRFPYRGTKLTSAQRMPWPRSGASERGGQPIASTEIPWRVQDAQCELALRALATDLQPDLDRGGQVQTETIDVLTTTWFEGAPAETEIPAVMGLLEPLLRGKTTETPTPYQAIPAVLSPFADNEFGMP